MSKIVTGCFIRVLRDGKWGNADIATLTDDELRAYFKRMREADGASLTGEDFAVFLAGWIRDHVQVQEEPDDPHP